MSTQKVGELPKECEIRKCIYRCRQGAIEFIWFCNELHLNDDNIMFGEVSRAIRCPNCIPSGKYDSGEERDRFYQFVFRPSKNVLEVHPCMTRSETLRVLEICLTETFFYAYNFD